MANKFLELAEERKQEAFAILNSTRILARDKGELADLLNKKVTIESVEIQKSRETGEPFVVFTIEEDVDHFYFAPTAFKKDVIFAHEKGYDIKELSGTFIMFFMKELDNDRIMYLYKIID